MLVALKSADQLQQVESELRGRGLWTKRLGDPNAGAALMVEHASAAVSPSEIREIPGVAAVYAEKSPHPAVDRQAAHHRAAARPLLLAGPCSVESEGQIHEAAKVVASAGGSYLRGGAFKPRTSPYSFSGHGVTALGWLAEAAREHGLGVVTEAMSEQTVDAVAEVADLIQVGSRNMANFALLAAVGRAAKPVLLKRGMAATVAEWLLAAEHLLDAGAEQVIFCERGIAGFDSSTRNLLDLGVVALLRHVYNLPVFVDPSHAVGRRDLIPALARAACAAGAEGLLIEMHPQPTLALSDGPQALLPDGLRQLAVEVGVMDQMR